MSDVVAPAGTITLPRRLLYAERQDETESWLDDIGTFLSGLPARWVPSAYAAGVKDIVKATEEAAGALNGLDDDQLQSRARQLRLQLQGGQFPLDLVAGAFALIREVSGRRMGMRHFDVQLLGGYGLLKGMITEMETGEGKTLTATLAAATAALAGIPVHVVTVNDYLAERDADLMKPLYHALGLSVGIIVHGMAPEDRKAAYRCDVTYCSNKEVAFDYLRDRMVLGQNPGNLQLKLEKLHSADARSSRLVMRGLHFAIIDEADSVLIDEARTPLIISKQTDPVDEQRRAEEALALVEPMQRDKDYKILFQESQIELTKAGKRHLQDLAEAFGGFWSSRIQREEAARQALTALLLFKRDEHYLVREDKVEIIDEYTGRISADRKWSDGLHQLIEVKEGCTVTGQNVPLARMTYQRFFRRYLHLSGMTGTGSEVAGELWAVYRLPVFRIPTNRPLQRVVEPDLVVRTADQKWRMITSLVAELHEQGKPVLIGTRSVASAETASRNLEEAGLEHSLLSAAQDSKEAEIIAQAGQTGQITIATNMAGRGVDIKLGTGVKDLGGLHVIVAERHDARRIDRQLVGRCARQGEPGVAMAILSMEDSIIGILGNPALTGLSRFGQWSGRVIIRYAQRRAERIHSRMRRSLIKYDRKLGTLLSFSGRLE